MKYFPLSSIINNVVISMYLCAKAEHLINLGRANLSRSVTTSDGVDGILKCAVNFNHLLIYLYIVIYFIHSLASEICFVAEIFSEYLTSSTARFHRSVSYCSCVRVFMCELIYMLIFKTN